MDLLPRNKKPAHVKKPVIKAINSVEASLGNDSTTKYVGIDIKQNPEICSALNNCDTNQIAAPNIIAPTNMVTEKDTNPFA